MPRPICVACAREMRCAQNGFVVHVTTAGLPYQIWYTDKYRCTGCGHEVVTAFSSRPIHAHEDRFEEHAARVQLEVG